MNVEVRFELVEASASSPTDPAGSGGGQRVVLAVERLDNRFLVLHRWRIVDSLATPVALRSNLPGVPASIAGAAVRFDQRAAAEGRPTMLLLYPGRYRILGAPSDWVTAQQEIRALGGGQERPVSLTYAATDALTARVRQDQVAAVRTCLDGSAEVPSGCPNQLRPDPPRQARIIRLPASFAVTAQPDHLHHYPGRLLLTTVAWRLGIVGYAGTEDAAAAQEAFEVFGGVVLSSDARRLERIETWSEPYPPG